MLYTFLISVVFIAELIILISIITALLRVDKLLISLNTTIDEAKSGIKDIFVLINKISEQCVELSEDFVSKIKEKEEDIALKQLNKLLVAILLFKINSKAIRKFNRSKWGKTLKRGFAFVQSMV